MSVEVVALGPEDWAVAREVRLRSLLDAPDAFWSVHADEVDQPESFWRELLGRETSTTFHARLDGGAVGCAVGAVHHAELDVAGLYAMWVAPEARGRGVGDALVATVTSWARTRGFAVLRFDVADDNAPARALYARHGAIPTGVRALFPEPRHHITEHELEIHLLES